MDDRTPPNPLAAPSSATRPASVRPPPSGPPAALPDITTGEIVMPEVPDDERATNPRGHSPLRGPETQVLVSRHTSVAPPVGLDDARAPAAPQEGASGGMRIVRRKIRKIGGDAAAAVETPVAPVVAAPVVALPAAAPEVVSPEVAPEAVAPMPSVPPEVELEVLASAPAGPDTTEQEAAPDLVAAPSPLTLATAGAALSAPGLPHDLAVLSDDAPDLDTVTEPTGEIEVPALDDEPTREMRAVGPAPEEADPEAGVVTAKVAAVAARPASVPPPPPSGAPTAARPPSVPPAGRVPSRPPPAPESARPSSIPMPPPPPRPAAPPLPVVAVAPVLLEAPPAPAAREDDHVEISLEDFAAEGPSDPSLALLDLLAELPVQPKEADAPKPSVARGSSLPPPPPDAARAPKAPPVPSSLRATAVTTRGRRRLWWEDLFNEDYFRTMVPATAAQVQREADWIDHALGVEHGATVLDVGCGTGRQAGALAQRGYKVLGLDYSPAMLSRAADNVRDLPLKPEFVQGDMAAMDFDGRFDAAYCVGTSFGYFDDERNIEVIRRIHRALKPHGTFLLEVLNRDHAIQRQPGMSWFEGDGCLCMEETAFNYITSRLNVKRTMIFDDGRQRELEYGVRLFSLHELGQMLHQTGFRVVEVSGHPRTPRAFFGPSSRQLIILAQKRAQEEVLPSLEG
jgi:SAM-dependent methyltransferase